MSGRRKAADSEIARMRRLRHGWTAVQIRVTPGGSVHQAALDYASRPIPACSTTPGGWDPEACMETLEAIDCGSCRRLRVARGLSELRAETIQLFSLEA